MRFCCMWGIIISTKEKQAAAKQTFVFLVLISEHVSAGKQTESAKHVHVSQRLKQRSGCEARACEPEIKVNKRLRSTHTNIRFRRISDGES